MISEEIKRKLSEGEHLTLECKKAKSELPKSVWETYSAFANTLGGTILLGVEEIKGEKEPDKRFIISGVEYAQKMVEDFWNTINSNKVSENILFDRDVTVVDVEGRAVIRINVPQADWRVKPVYLNENILKGSFKRNHEGDYHCTEREVRTMIRDASEDGNDGALMEGFTMEDIDMDTLRRYRNVFRTANNGHPWNDVDDKTFLMNLKGYTVDRKTRQEGLTAAGLMMFGKGLSISERFGNFRMDYLDMSNLIGEERYKYRLTYDGRWENNFYQFFTIVLPKLTFDMPRPFRLKDGIQRIDDTIQIAAVREAFTNSIIHCDVFGASGILRIEKHDDKLVFRNPGTLLIPLEQVYAGGSPKARNPRIQTLLRMIGFGENVGSGFPKIISAWKDAGWDIPILENDLVSEEVKLTLFVPDLKEESGIEVINEPITGIEPTNEPINEPTTGIEPTNEPTNEPITGIEPTNEPRKRVKKEAIKTQEQELILQILKERPTITRMEIAAMLNMSRSTVFRMIGQMKANGLIERVGPNKGGYWKVLIP